MAPTKFPKASLSHKILQILIIASLYHYSHCFHTLSLKNLNILSAIRQPSSILQYKYSYTETGTNSNDKTPKYSIGWDSSLKDPFLGYKVITDYITLTNNPNKKIFFSMIKNTKNLTNPPIVIANTGGPGVMTQYALFWGGGPYHYDPYTKKISTRTIDSILEFADLLLPDFPNGTGFSQTDYYDKSTYDFESTILEFFNILSLSSSAKAQKVNIKNREIILFGLSYGCALLAQVAVKLIDKGFLVKGLYAESPYVNQLIFTTKFPELLQRFNIQIGESLTHWTYFS